MPSRWRSALSREMNLTPLLDVIFCLLFFFILATSLKEKRQALEIRVPESSQNAAQVDQTPRLEVLITRENEIVFEGVKLTGAELAPALVRARKAMAPNAEVLIRTDGEANVQTFLEVSDACAKAGLEAALMETLPNRD